MSKIDLQIKVSKIKELLGDLRNVSDEYSELAGRQAVLFDRMAQSMGLLVEVLKDIAYEQND